MDTIERNGRERPIVVPFSKHEILIFGGYGYSGNFDSGFIVNTARDMRVEQVFTKKKSGELAKKGNGLLKSGYNSSCFLSAGKVVTLLEGKCRIFETKTRG